MAADNLEAVFDHMFGSEGGYSTDPDDTGNWTGGAKNSGKLNGSKYGISAAAYPHLDIKNLTKAQAIDIYRRDYWNAVKGDELPYGVDLVVFDAAVNSGVNRGARWVQRAASVAQDGRIGPLTLAALRTADPHTIIDRALDLRFAAMKTYATWPVHKNGWTKRIKAVREAAHAMARAPIIDSVVPAEELANAVEIKFLITALVGPEGKLISFKTEAA
jgi:lysozyme family protein